MTRTASAAPTRKVIAATGGGGVSQAASEVFLYFLEQALNHPLPDNIRLAFSIVVVAAGAFAAGYFVPPSDGEVLIEGEVRRESPPTN